MDFTGKNVLITGASRGIGRATALAFAERGARVGVNYRSDEEAAQTTLQQMEGNRHLPLKFDISKESEGQQLLREFVEECGSLDILVNNAGHRENHPVDETDFDDWQQAWDRILDTNLRGTAHLCYGAAQQMNLAVLIS